MKVNPIMVEIWFNYKLMAILDLALKVNSMVGIMALNVFQNIIHFVPPIVTPINIESGMMLYFVINYS